MTANPQGRTLILLLGFCALAPSCSKDAENPTPLVRPLVETPAQPQATLPEPDRDDPWFVDEATRRGLTMLNQTGRPGRKEFLMSAVGPGAAVLDADGDGRLDIYLPNGNWLSGPQRRDFYMEDDRPRNALYIQREDGTFVDEAEARGVDDDRWSFGACAADLDNDGDQDLVVSNLNLNRLYINDGTGHFTDIAVEAGIAGQANEWTTGIGVGDYDRDGRLDLYIANYADMFKWLEIEPKIERNPDNSIKNAAVCTWERIRVSCGPLGLPPLQDYLYRNVSGKDGELRFEDRTRQGGIWRPEEDGGPLYGFQVIFTDLNGDNWPDLYIANDSMPSFFLENRKDGSFKECAKQVGIATGHLGQNLAGMGADTADINNDGLLDVFKTNFAMQTNNVYVAFPFEGGIAYHDLSPRCGIKQRVYADLGWAVCVFDFDNDGDRDLFFSNGHVYPEVDSRPELGTSFDQYNRIFTNETVPGSRKIKFREFTMQAGPGFEIKKGSRGTSLIDFDDDGDLDLFIVNLNDKPNLLVNRRGDRNGHWLRIKVKGDPSKKVNLEAIGTKLKVTAGGRVQYFEVKRGQGFLGNHDPRVHVGLGAHTGAVKIDVTWPDGRKTSHVVDGVDRDVPLSYP